MGDQPADYLWVDPEFPQAAHRIGDDKCEECWGDWPQPCQCGGLIHASFGDETADGYWLWKRCDKCGDDWEPA